MKTSRVLTILLYAASGLLMIFGYVLYLGKDRIPPEISFSENDMIYTPDSSNAEMLAGISAVDSHDGDVTDRVVVEKVIVDKNDGTVVVYYAASDASGNVTKASRLFPIDRDSFEEAQEK